MDLQATLDEIHHTLVSRAGEGEVASYIPALGGVDDRKFGLAIETVSGDVYSAGDSQDAFSIQSISKAFTLTMALGILGERLFQRVGIEPSGSPFNSLVQLEYERGIPRNPFINAGALVVVDVLLDHLGEPNDDLSRFVGRLLGGRPIPFDEVVVESERKEGYRNVALVNFMKSFSNIHHDVDSVLDVYFHQCAISMSCAELARAFLFLANGGIVPGSGERILTQSQTKRLNAILLTCGVYDEAGEFAYRVGMPAKSGVGGGIVAVMPGKYVVAVRSPGLNPHGNSLLGVEALEMLTTMTGISIF